MPVHIGWADGVQETDNLSMHTKIKCYNDENTCKNKRTLLIRDISMDN